MTTRLQPMHQSPRGRLGTKARPFEQVVNDLRHVVYAVIRTRQRPDGKFDALALGSGFFVSRTVFLTCFHVINGRVAPHQDGDSYMLVNNLGENGTAHTIRDARTGKNLHVFPGDDLALLQDPALTQACFAALDYGFVREGREIGVAGYPIPILGTVNDQLVFNGLIFRVAKSVVTGRYNTNIQPTGETALADVPVIEVNFLFVPGNSGGPIFDAEHGQVLGFVHGFRSFTVGEEVAEAGPLTALPDGVSRQYVRSVSGIYSLGIKLDRAREPLEGLGVLI